MSAQDMKDDLVAKRDDLQRMLVHSSRPVKLQALANATQARLKAIPGLISAAAAMTKWQGAK